MHALTVATDQLTLVEVKASHGGSYRRYRHSSNTLNCEMTFGIFLPPQLAEGPCPVVWWLSGLTCTDENFMQKAGAHRVAAERGLVLICPDTSPRAAGIDGEDDSISLGTGASFYVNATQQPWRQHYRMYDYVIDELPALVEAAFPVSGRASIMGHSMGGLGALICALRQPERYRAVTAFAPIVHPSDVPWGQNAFNEYLGDNSALWEDYDPCCLVRKSSVSAATVPISIEQGDADPFLEKQLRPWDFEKACQANHYPLTLRLRQGYDHSYFFVASFIDEHLHHHARALYAKDNIH